MYYKMFTLRIDTNPCPSIYNILVYVKQILNLHKVII